MSFCRFVPRALAACFILALFSTAAHAQIDLSRSRQVIATIDSTGTPSLETDPVIISLAPEDVVPAIPFSGAPTARAAGQLNQLLLAAIETRIGTPYRMGATGPYRYDCSGFVWSVFQSAGVEFERSSARSFWTRFAPASAEDKYKFGTLVFFNNLGHIGIVADEGGFYHASTSKGVVYSPFNEYWSSRVDGFRRIPLQEANFVALAK